MQKHLYPVCLLVFVLIFMIWSACSPIDTRLTWLLESMPVLIALPILLATYKRFPLSYFIYTLIAIHCVILMYGGHYSYAKAPLGFWMSDLFGWERNNYDKLGHFMQGFGPVLYAREILLRTSPLQRGKWLAFICGSISLAISALYEIIEWLASLSNPTDTEAFLGTQGYIWDTQTDMAMCLVGSVVALICFSKIHDWSLRRVE